jgi:uncharacterized protein YqjF (DUF2071 family)
VRIQSRIERRLLLNYRADPEVLAQLLPTGLRPQLVEGWGVAGICLIRLGSVRPHGVPAKLGVATENAAHRIAVEWQEAGQWRAGVYVPRRDTDSRLTEVLGGRVFPGLHQRARFQVEETDEQVRVAFTTSDGATKVDAEVRRTRELRGSRLFRDLETASTFFQSAPTAWSPRRDGRLEAVSLHTDAWSIEAAEPLRVRSSFFDDRTRFPTGSVTLDSAMLMVDVPVRWDALAC